MRRLMTLRRERICQGRGDSIFNKVHYSNRRGNVWKWMEMIEEWRSGLRRMATVSTDSHQQFDSRLLGSRLGVDSRRLASWLGPSFQSLPLGVPGMGVSIECDVVALSAGNDSFACRAALNLHTTIKCMYVNWTNSWDWLNWLGDNDMQMTW